MSKSWSHQSNFKMWISTIITRCKLGRLSCVITYMILPMLHNNAPIHILPHHPPRSNVWGIWLRLNEKCPPRVENLTSNPQSGVSLSRGFDHPTCPNGEVFTHLFDQIPSLPVHRGAYKWQVHKLHIVTCMLVFAKWIGSSSQYVLRIT